MQNLELDENQLRDLAKLMHLAAEQCKWKFYTLAQQGMRRTQEGKTVENALAAALYYEGVFKDLLERWYKEAKDGKANEGE